MGVIIADIVKMVELCALDLKVGSKLLLTVVFIRLVITNLGTPEVLSTPGREGYSSISDLGELSVEIFLVGEQRVKVNNATYKDHEIGIQEEK